MPGACEVREGVGFPGTGVLAGFKQTKDTGTQTQVLCKNNTLNY